MPSSSLRPRREELARFSVTTLTSKISKTFTSPSLSSDLSAPNWKMMLQVIDRPLRVGYVVSYFHPFASGAERQALAQGSELVRRGHTVHVITKAVPGYPVD